MDCGLVEPSDKTSFSAFSHKGSWASTHFRGVVDTFLADFLGHNRPLICSCYACLTISQIYNPSFFGTVVGSRGAVVIIGSNPLIAVPKREHFRLFTTLPV